MYVQFPQVVTDLVFSYSGRNFVPSAHSISNQIYTPILKALKTCKNSAE